MGEVGIGVIGAGQIAGLLVESLRRHGRSRVVAVCDSREDVALSRALEWGAELYTTDVEEVLRSPEVGAVVIATPSHLHASLVMSALRAGRHAAVARPLALELSDADAIVQLARTHQAVVAVLEPMQHHTPLMDAAAFLESGEVGSLQALHVRACFGAPEGGWKIAPESWLWRFDPARSGGGPFLFDAVYEGLVAATLLAGRVERLQAWVERTEIYPGYAVDAPVTCMWRHKAGGVGSLALTYTPELYIKSEHYPTEVRLDVTGSRGVLEVRLSSGRLGSGPALVMYRDGRVFSFGDVEDRWSHAFDRAAGEFVDTVLDGGGVSCPPEIARQHLELALVVRESSRSGKALQPS